MTDQPPEEIPAPPSLADLAYSLADLCRSFGDRVRKMESSSLTAVTPDVISEHVNVWMSAEFGRQLEAIEKRFDDLNDWKDDVETTAGDAESKVDALDRDVEHLDNKFDMWEGKIDDVVGANDRMYSTVQDIESKMEELPDFDEIETTASDALAKAEEVEEKIDDRLSDMETVIEEKLGEVEGDMALLDGKVDDLVHRIEAVEDEQQDLASLTARVSVVEEVLRRAASAAMSVYGASPNADTQQQAPRAQSSATDGDGA